MLPSFRAFAALAVILATTGVGGRSALAALDAAAPPPLHIAADGSDSGACSREAPCRSFEGAYQRARPGSVILVRAGTYPEQTVPADEAKKAATTDVLFRPAPGARVVVAGDLNIYASRVEFRDLEAVLWHVRPGAEHVTLRNLDVERFYITSAANVRVLGGDVGPSVDKVSQIRVESGSSVPPRNILLTGLLMHDFTRSNKSKHMECLHVMAVDGLTIRNSRFRRCSIFDISFNEHGDSDAMRGILVENNFFDRTLDGGHYAVHFSSGDPCEALIRFNTFLQGVSAECPETGAGVRFESNILPSMNSRLCGRNGYSFDWNVYESGERCGANDRVGQVRFVDRDSFDLRLAPGRSAAVGRGKLEGAPVADILGQRRPTRWQPDAGAHQREPALIVPGRSIGGFWLGARRATVEARYGGGQSRGAARRDYSVPGGRLWVHYRGGSVIALGTTSKYYITATGIGPGSSISANSGVRRLAWNDCRKAFVRRVGSVSIYYAPAGGKSAPSLGSISMFGRAADGCAR